VPVPVIKVFVLIISHFNHPIFCTKGIGIVISNFMMENLYGPVFNIPAVEKFDPFFFGRKTK
jgi:hypothetical protein